MTPNITINISNIAGLDELKVPLVEITYHSAASEEQNAAEAQRQELLEKARSMGIFVRSNFTVSTLEEKIKEAEQKVTPAPAPVTPPAQSSAAQPASVQSLNAALFQS